MAVRTRAGQTGGSPSRVPASEPSFLPNPRARSSRGRRAAATASADVALAVRRQMPVDQRRQFLFPDPPILRMPEEDVRRGLGLEAGEQRQVVALPFVGDVVHDREVVDTGHRLDQALQRLAGDSHAVEGDAGLQGEQDRAVEHRAAGIVGGRDRGGNDWLPGGATDGRRTAADEANGLTWIKKGGLSYTIDTIRALMEKTGKSFRLILGEDLVADFAKWKEASALIRLAPPLIGERDAISATHIRNLFVTGREREAEELVPPAVFDYILKKGLYGQTPT